MPNFRLLTQLGEKLISVWALVGGLILLSVVSLNIGSIIGGILLIHVPGDFELTQIGVAVAVFCFLPYCQLRILLFLLLFLQPLMILLFHYHLQIFRKKFQTNLLS